MVLSATELPQLRSLHAEAIWPTLMGLGSGVWKTVKGMGVGDGRLSYRTSEKDERVQEKKGETDVQRVLAKHVL